MLKRVVEECDTNAGRAFDLAVQVLILVSIISFTVDTLRGLSSSTRSILRAIEIGCVCLFTIEYLLRVAVSAPKLRYIFSFYGFVDLFAILPFYAGVALDLRALRSLRFLRLFRVLKLTRYNSAAVRFQSALRIAKEEIVLFLGATLVLLYLASVGIYFFESSAQPEQFGSVFHSLWWAVATLTTVGYGDVYPVTTGGKVFTFFVLLLGLGIVSVPAGLIASALGKARQFEDEGD